MSLIKIWKHLDLLEKYFGEVQIPIAVYNELVCDSRFMNEAEQIIHCRFIKVVDTMNAKSVDLLRRATGLDLGESEAIILTDEIHADLLERNIYRCYWIKSITVKGNSNCVIDHRIEESVLWFFYAYNFKKNTKHELLFCTFSFICGMIIVVQIFMKTMLFSGTVSTSIYIGLQCRKKAFG